MVWVELYALLSLWAGSEPEPAGRPRTVETAVQKRMDSQQMMGYGFPTRTYALYRCMIACIQAYANVECTCLGECKRKESHTCFSQRIFQLPPRCHSLLDFRSPELPNLSFCEHQSHPKS